MKKITIYPEIRKKTSNNPLLSDPPNDNTTSTDVSIITSSTFYSVDGCKINSVWNTSSSLFFTIPRILSLINKFSFLLTDIQLLSSLFSVFFPLLFLSSGDCFSYYRFPLFTDADSIFSNPRQVEMWEMRERVPRWKIHSVAYQ